MSYSPDPRYTGTPLPYAPNPNPIPIGAVAGHYVPPPPYSPTRRERFAIEALRALGANGFNGTMGELAEEAVRLADKLLTKLDKKQS